MLAKLEFVLFVSFACIRILGSRTDNKNCGPIARKNIKKIFLGANRFPTSLVI